MTAEIYKSLFSNNSILQISENKFTIDEKNNIEFARTENFVILFFKDINKNYNKYNKIISKLAPSISNCIFAKCNDEKILKALNCDVKLIFFKNGKIYKEYLDYIDYYKILNFCLL
jgi:hypothetical protein